MLSPTPLRPSFHSQRGFTLVETLVAMLTGVIVTGALFSILDFSVKQSARISESAASTQRARGTMTRIQDLLHSACLSPKFTPVEVGSTEKKLVLVSGYSEQAEVPSTWTTREVTEAGVKRKYLEGVRKDEIEWTGSATKTLVDTYALGTGESSGKYSFGTAKAVKIGEQISQIEAPTQLPIFKYWKYNATAVGGTGEASSTLAELKPANAATGFTEAEANQVAAVTVSFNTAPVTSETTKELRTKRGRTADMTTTTTLAFSAPNAEGTITAGPCE